MFKIGDHVIYTHRQKNIGLTLNKEYIAKEIRSMNGIPEYICVQDDLGQVKWYFSHRFEHVMETDVNRDYPKGAWPESHTCKFVDNGFSRTMWCSHEGCKNER